MLYTIQCYQYNESGRPKWIRRSVYATPKDAMKLRMTGFECSPSFVIRLGMSATSVGGWGPPLAS